MVNSKVIVTQVFFLKHKMAKTINAKSAKISKGFVVGSASAIPKVIIKIKGMIIIIPCKKMNE